MPPNHRLHALRRRAAAANGHAGPVLAGPAALTAVERGMATLAGVLRTTIGPYGRLTAVSSGIDRGAPELLDTGATVARRVVRLGDPWEDMGAMLLRHLVWRVRERAGDGSATAGVLAHAVVRDGATALAWGHRERAVRRGLDAAGDAVRAALRRQRREVDGAAALADLVAGALREPALATLIGEAVDAVGPDGLVEVEPGRRLASRLEYVEGTRWPAGVASPYFLPGPEPVARLVDARVLLVDQPVESVDALAPALEACLRAGGRELLVVAPSFGEAAVGLLIANRDRGALRSLAVTAPGHGGQQSRMLEDLATLTGARLVSHGAGDRLDRLTADHLGRARHAWADRRAFGLAGAAGQPRAVADRLAAARRELRAELARDDDRHTQTVIRARIARLAGSVAILHVGGATESERDERIERARAAVGAAQSALAEGVVPGGGAAWLACLPAIDTLDLPPDARPGAHALRRALEQPARAIMANAGLDPTPYLAEARARPPGTLYDVVERRWRTDAVADPLPVLATALDLALSLAGTTLSIGALVRRREPPVAVDP